MPDCVEIGTALNAIRDHKLFRGTHPSFEAYCRDRCRLTRFHAYRLMAAARVARLLKENQFDPPTREGLLRPLTRLTSAQVLHVWTRCLARASGKALTSRLIETVVTEFELSRQVNPEPPKATVTRSRQKKHPEPRDVLSTLFRAKLLVERGYTDEALRALQAIEAVLERIPGKCNECLRRNAALRVEPDSGDATRAAV